MTLKLDIAKNVATITFDRPQINNAFDNEIINELHQSLNTVKNNADVRALVLKANGKHFSAGADLNWMKSTAGFSQDENEQDAIRLSEMLQTLAELPIPTIALAKGASFGGGAGIIACCDIVIAADNAVFSFSEAKLGLIPAVISPFVIDAIGKRAAKKLFLTAERFDSHSALALGLVHQVSAVNELDIEAEKMIATLLANGPTALKEIKILVNVTLGTGTVASVYEETAKTIARIRTSAEGQEGLSAFLEKRKPSWSHKEK